MRPLPGASVLDSDVAYALLDRHAGGTWIAGGCGLLAGALKLLMPTGEVVAIHGFSADGGHETNSGPQHVVLRIGDEYWDGRGIQTEEELLEYWGEEEFLEIQGIRPFDGDDEIPMPPEGCIELAALLAPCCNLT